MLLLAGLAAMAVKTPLAILAEASGQGHTALEDYSSFSTNTTSKQAGSFLDIHSKHFQKTVRLSAMPATRLDSMVIATKIQQT